MFVGFVFVKWNGVCGDCLGCFWFGGFDLCDGYDDWYGLLVIGKSCCDCLGQFYFVWFFVR